jgi:hypothetical protein
VCVCVCVSIYIRIYKPTTSPTTHILRCRGERMYSSYSFTISALDGVEWSASRPGRALPPGKRTPGTHCTGGWVNPRAGLDREVRGKISCPCQGSNLDRPVVQSVVARPCIERYTCLYICKCIVKWKMPLW